MEVMKTQQRWLLAGQGRGLPETASSILTLHS